MLPQTVILLICFFGAGLLGCFAVSVVGEAGAASLSSYLHGYAGVLREGAAAQPSLPSIIWELCRWPLLVFLLGFTALGAAVVPAVFCARGFLLAYSVASFVRVFGTAGLPAALAVFGMTALASVPVLFCVGSVSFQNALGLAARTPENRPAALSREGLMSLIPCGVLLALAVILQYSLMPQLLSLAAGILPDI